MKVRHPVRRIYSRLPGVAGSMRRRLRLLCLLGLSTFTGCAGRPVVSPVPIVGLASSSLPIQERTLILCLPGARSTAADFKKHGFGETAAESLGSSVDVIAVDLHRGYYEDRQVPNVLYTQVVAPARSKGYREVWIAGISMGGLGALIHDLRYPNQADRLILIAPFLGEAEAVAEVADAGLQAWQPGAIADADFSRRLWKGLQETNTLTPDRLFLGYGKRDRFAEDNAFLAREFRLQARTTSGGHTWRPWKTLWPLLLQDAAAAAGYDVPMTGP